MVLGAAASCTQPARAQAVGAVAVARNRIVHRFDFDERAAGNLEDLPMFWGKLRPEGFPHYTIGAFDAEVGRTAPPSFHIASEGRNVAFGYNGPATRVRTNTDYRIVGSIKPDRLMTARATLSAYYLDRLGVPIVGTTVRSPYVRSAHGAGLDSDWVEFELFLPAAPPQAYTIGLVAWVMQESAWNMQVPPRRHIPRNDVRGGAWFDDITVYALPRVEMSTTGPGNVLPPDGPQEMHVVLADSDDPSLRGRLSILAADGALVEEHTIPVVTQSPTTATRVPVDHLAPGLYHATLDVFAGRQLVVSRSLTFARLGDLHARPEAHVRSFGVVLFSEERSDPTTELALMRNLHVRSAKVPVWTGLPGDPPTLRERRDTDRLLQELVKSGFALTGVLAGPPGVIVRTDGAYVRPLIELLSGDPTVWQEHLANVVAPYASAFRWWQIGTDGGGNLVIEDEFSLAAEQLREGMRRFITLPRLAVATSSAMEASADKLPVEQIVLGIRNGLPVDTYGRLIEQTQSLGYERTSAFVEPLPEERYRRLPLLAEWSQRIIEARHAGADTVFAPQPWSVKDGLFGKVAQPRETYLIMRTIAGVIGDGEPGWRLRVAEGVECLTFHDGTSATVVMWDNLAPPGGRTHAFQLGQADRMIDLWGATTMLERGEDGRQLITLSAMPVVIQNVERWLVDFRASLALDPSDVASGTELVGHSLEMGYRGDKPVSGRIVIGVPKTWEVSPRALNFSLMPQRIARYPVQIHYPHNEPSGLREVRAKIALNSPRYFLEVPVTVNLGVADLRVWGSAVVDGNTLVLRHFVTNLSTSVLSFRGSAIVPGRERQYRPLSNLEPGDTQSVEYRFGGGRSMIGRSARLILREMNDGPRIHNLALDVP